MLVQLFLGEKILRTLSLSLPQATSKPENNELVTIPELKQTEILVIGGFPDDEYGRRVMKYDTDRRVWTKMPDIKTGRYFHACALQEAEDGVPYVVVAGGRAGKLDETQNLRSTELYFPNNGTTVKAGSMKRIRWGHSLLTVNSPNLKTYAIGGGKNGGAFGWHDRKG